ncbi:NAD(P)H-binding protein [Janthinobacterium sp. SUN100]|nr:NAD(P)H-binding protein [Janthinobacterium sp. SUN100]MDN2700842.1 NAD(P)H-binding protein [Janthinobacterium sp. SUN100]
MEDPANSIISAMRTSGVERLVFILSMGIYGEAPGTFGEWTNARLAQHLKLFRRHHRSAGLRIHDHVSSLDDERRRSRRRTNDAPRATQRHRGLAQKSGRPDRKHHRSARLAPSRIWA